MGIQNVKIEAIQNLNLEFQKIEHTNWKTFFHSHSNTTTLRTKTLLIFFLPMAEKHIRQKLHNLESITLAQAAITIPVIRWISAVMRGGDEHEKMALDGLMQQFFISLLEQNQVLKRSIWKCTTTS